LFQGDGERRRGGGRREEIAAVERAGNGLERVFGIGELVRLRDATELLGGGNEKTVVGPDVEASLPVSQRERAPRSANARIDDGEVDSLRHEGERIREGERTLQNGLRRDSVRDVDDVDLRRDALHHAVAGADEVVFEAEVRQERDESRHAAAESTRPLASRVFASATTTMPSARAAAMVCGPIEIAGTDAPSQAQARAADGEASRTRSP